MLQVKRKRWLVLVLLVALTCGFFAWRAWTRPVTTLPEVTQVRGMRAFIGNSPSGRDDELAPFEVPPDHIPSILGALGRGQPRPDLKGQPLCGLGTLWLFLQDGREVTVYLSYRGKNVLFAVGVGADYVLYEGGPVEDLERAVSEAHAARPKKE